MGKINVMIIKLNGNDMTTKELFHDCLKQKLTLPDYYGNNLDALWDVLSTYSEKLHLILSNKVQLLKNLGDYGHSIIQLFEDVVKENDNITFDNK